MIFLKSYFYPSNNNYTSCNICLDEYSLTEENACMKLQCGHIFHEHCITPWIANQKSCPSCRGRSIIPLSKGELLREFAAQGLKVVKATGNKLLGPLVGILSIAIANQLFPGRSPQNCEELEAMKTMYNVNDSYGCYELTAEDMQKLGLVLSGTGLALGSSIVTYRVIKNKMIGRAQKISYRPRTV